MLPTDTGHADVVDDDQRTATLAPGSVVEVRDEEWLVTGVQTVYERANHQERVPSKPVQRIEVQGLSELVRDTSAIFFDSIDTVTPIDPRQAPLVNDPSSGYRDAKLWLEATLMKTATAVEDTNLTVADGMLIDPKDYQRTPVRKILDPRNLRPRILLADAVGLGKTIEIGLILAELIKRGRGDRILIVTPKHVLEQMQHEMWTKFAIPFVRLDSQGIQRIRQKLPATRNPFTYFKRAIISIDTLKSDRYLSHLRRHKWDAVVIDESHNVTNTSSLNHRLADTLAKNTDALILASATPHNGKKESFAELIRLLEPTAVNPDGSLDEDAVKNLIVRRHRYSEDVKKEVGADWAERKEPQARVAYASLEENAVAEELDQIWLHPIGSSPYSGRTSLFPWTLAKAFLSSPEALVETIDNRLRVLSNQDPSDAVARERTYLDRLREYAVDSMTAVERNRTEKRPQTGKYGALLDYLKEIGIGPKNDTRVVIFAERVATLHALQRHLTQDLKLKDDQLAILHGGLSDVEQQDVVESFKKKSSPIRVLVTGDLASEGVNLHSQCHELIHFDIPWSLIRIEQRNGRIDRYGQTERPQITTLVLQPESERFSGDIRVLKKLIEKENEAHTALGDAAALMGKYTAEAEEEAIKAALAKGQDLDEVVADVSTATQTDELLNLIMTGISDEPASTESSGNAVAANGQESETLDSQPTSRAATGLSLYSSPVEFLEDGLAMVYGNHPEQKPAADGGGGVSWQFHSREAIAELEPPRDMWSRLESLPQSYLKERNVKANFKLATNKLVGRTLVEAARNSLDSKNASLWPEAHYLGPLHPVLEWVADRALSRVPERGGIYVIRAEVEAPTVVVHAGLTNLRGQVVSSIFRTVVFPGGNPDFGLTGEFADAEAVVADLGLRSLTHNPGVIKTENFQPLVPAAIDAVAESIEEVIGSGKARIERRVHEWFDRNEKWKQGALDLVQGATVKHRLRAVSEEDELIRSMQPNRSLLRPLLVAVPTDTPVCEMFNENAEEN
ncbi:helicase-related protein [Brevibacterium spongiae]|uniref:DEAD/DEAH box helicase n=1 Tax=Brevibacterium spongiae TaxID=2909672 RepID=A0ABY5SJL9_9MICO|nr:helicase-related protein [Brevibacterium spongiae]UVI34727.1 DEAD/DEAH box helicase [Brevibacterium spongiae]